MWSQISRFEVADESPGFLLWQTFLVWRRQIEAKLAPHELTHIQFVLLAGLGYLTREGASTTQSALAKFTRCDVTMTSQVLRGLEKRGFITRSQKIGDERAKYPTLTTTGRDKLKDAMYDVEAVDGGFFGVLGEDLSRFCGCLRELIV